MGMEAVVEEEGGVPNKDHGPEEVQAIVVRESRDEDQILAEMQGAALDEFVYDFQQGNRRIVGLSYAGVKQIAHRIGNIRVLEMAVNEAHDPDGNTTGYMVKCKARNDATNQEMFGVAQEDVNKQWGRDGFALAKAVSKAGETKIGPGSVLLVEPNEEHNFVNTGDKPFVFLCLIPLQK